MNDCTEPNHPPHAAELVKCPACNQYNEVADTHLANCAHYCDDECVNADAEVSKKHELTQLIDWASNNHVQVAQYGTWFGTYTGETRPKGSDGCISYEQTFLTALRQAQVILGR